MTVQSALMAGVQTLKLAGIDGAARDARVLMSAALGIDASRLTLCLHDPIADDVRSLFEGYIAARQTYRPVSRILGRREFWGRSFKISDDVLDPRGDTETLIAEALRHAPQRFLDLGTGSGIIAITLLAEVASCTGVAVDISDRALDIARYNARQHNVEDRLEILTGSWFAPVAGVFDLILSNPPYITETEMTALAPDVALFDPKIALTPGGDGLDAYREIAAQAKMYLTQTGAVIVEIGHLQAKDVTQIFQFHGFGNVTVIQDFDQKDRVIVAKL